MTIEIHHPETEALIQQRLQNSGFRDAEEVVLHALRTSPQPKRIPQELQGKRLVDVCAMVHGLLTDEEVDTLFRRDKSPDRPVDIS